MSTRRPVFLPWKRKRWLKEDRTKSKSKEFPKPVLEEIVFSQMLRFERRRTERSGRPFMLVLISSKDFLEKLNEILVYRITDAIAIATRETDILGWYEENLILGLLMPEIGAVSSEAIGAIRDRMSAVLNMALGSSDNCHPLTLAFHIFPQEMETRYSKTGKYTFYPDCTQMKNSRKRSELLKRATDIVGSLTALAIFFPLIVVVAILIKLSSRGPVLFSQDRIGQHGKEFRFFKFRTMDVNNDSSIHREYIAKLIAGQNDTKDGRSGLFKLVNDPRVTCMGKFLRRTSLDELPQFINVLLGSMSLVGPRPPLSYEYQRYKVWHKRRVLELKPGLTGLWQIEGRSRTTFDEMVRLDIQYLTKKSIWIDIKILLRTPMAMFTGNGAY